MEFNYSPTGASSLPSWQESFSAPSVVPGNYSSAFGSSGPSFNSSAFDPSFTIPGVSYAPPSSYGTQPASSNWKDYLTAGGYILDKTGQVIRAYKGEPIFSGGSSLSTDIEAEEKRRAGEESLAKLLKEIGVSSSTDAIAGVLDPAADRRKNPRSFGQLPSLSNFSSGGTRIAGDVFS
tara:strand:+ start:4435 stop:4968 length:534 start_codon:yes stop_codon:yes gene_type:complete